MVRSRLTYANVVASIALFASLGGGAYAALKLPRNSVGAAQIRPNAVRSSDVKNGSLTVKDFAANQLPAGAQGAQGPKGDPGAPGAPGTNGTDGLNGTARAYGYVSPNGTVHASKGVGTIDHVADTGTYCIHLTGGFDPTTTGVVITPELEEGATFFGTTGDEPRTIAEWRVDPGDCTGADVVQVQTGKQTFAGGVFTGNVADDEGFFFAVP
jgi:hypothetical protein